MKLGEWIKQYRSEHGLSMQAMADMCGFSKAYIGMLEKGINPTTKKPLSPTLQTFNKIATGVGINIDAFISLLDKDQPITIPHREKAKKSISVTDAELKHLENYRDLDDTQKKMIDVQINALNKMDTQN